MQTFKHKTISDYYCLITNSSCEYLSSKSINYGNFPMLLNDDWTQMPESDYLRIRDQTLHFLNEMRPPVTGASKYLNETSNPLTAE